MNEREILDTLDSMSKADLIDCLFYTAEQLGVGVEKLLSIYLAPSQSIEEVDPEDTSWKGNQEPVYENSGHPLPHNAGMPRAAPLGYSSIEHYYEVQRKSREVREDE